MTKEKGEKISDADRKMAALLSDHNAHGNNDAEGGGGRARGFQKTNG